MKKILDNPLSSIKKSGVSTLIKQSIFLSLAFGILLASTIASYATVHTVSNNSNSPGQFTNLQTAIDAAAVDDTKYVHASNQSYGNITLKKRLVLIGAGYNIPNSSLKSQLGNVTVDSSNTHVYNGGKIIGFLIQSPTSSTALSGTPNINSGVGSYIVERCHIIGGNSCINVPGSNWVIRNCILQGNASLFRYQNGTPQPSHNVILANNIFLYGGVEGTSAPSLPVNGTIVTNNFFAIANGYYLAIQKLANAVITNNIFQFEATANTTAVYFSNGVSSCTFNNNLTYGATTPGGTQQLPPSGNNNTGTGNFNNINPNHVSLPANATLFYQAQPFTYDFTLNTGSVAINAGTDTTNIGPTGGAYPMSVFNGLSRIPWMQQLTILNPVINAGQPLNIQFKASKHD